MIANILRAETAEKHKALEQLMFVDKIMNKSLTREEFKKLITINYIIHQRLENELANKLDVSLAEEIDMASRLKLGALEQDLDYWGIDTLTLPELNFELYIPARNNAEVLGALYVLEGATLGGNVIKKQLLDNENFSDVEGGLNYYGVYGGELGMKWKKFVDVLNSRVSEDDYQRCVDSANNTFDNLINLSRQFSQSNKSTS
ncbi:biliverdin-producing heme oxygenase [Pedobacter sandarakinus]|uniref:biliverdin-producing heme oxygenase n=1 Tax=Pedobacter sandarakinus TaxID=353156 RepID=UPI0022459B13|nr:biliverdin-producing heme oxygenase [Pedobacter sandarakinus]MCX2574202.1 biliverdin-producing heme oxygenase [Pedobacter sandarakinus]